MTNKVEGLAPTALPARVIFSRYALRTELKNRKPHMLPYLRPVDVCHLLGITTRRLHFLMEVGYIERPPKNPKTGHYLWTMADVDLAAMAIRRHPPKDGKTGKYLWSERYGPGRRGLEDEESAA